MNRKLVVAPGIAAVVFIALACAGPPELAGSAALAATQSGSEQRIEHVVPRRDFVGGMPEKYEWTAVKGADRYSLGVWNEVDQMIFRQDGIPTTTYQWPPDSKLDMGTYYWSVTAWSGDRAIAGSGLAAFVVNR
jgi:hypothetical protein